MQQARSTNAPQDAAQATAARAAALQATPPLAATSSLDLNSRDEGSIGSNSAPAADSSTADISSNGSDEAGASFGLSTADAVRAADTAQHGHLSAGTTATSAATAAGAAAESPAGSDSAASDTEDGSVNGNVATAAMLEWIGSMARHDAADASAVNSMSGNGVGDVRAAAANLQASTDALRLHTTQMQAYTEQLRTERGRLEAAQAVTEQLRTGRESLEAAARGMLAAAQESVPAAAGDAAAQSFPLSASAASSDAAQPSAAAVEAAQAAGGGRMGDTNAGTVVDSGVTSSAAGDSTLPAGPSILRRSAISYSPRSSFSGQAPFASGSTAQGLAMQQPRLLRILQLGPV